MGKQLHLTCILILGALDLAKRCEGKLEGKIINGFSADIEYFPFMASLQVEERHICGAAIVSKKMLITAAHCDVYPSEFYQIRVGSSYYDHGGLLANVSEVIKHPDYNRSTADYDVAVVLLLEELNYAEFPRRIASIPLPEKGYTPPSGLGVVVAGWGTTDRNDDAATSTRLQSATQRVMSNEECVKKFPPDAITARMLCAQNYNQRQDACTGDSGGPLCARGRLIGVVSWGVACADGTTPGVYTNVPSVLDFIEAHFQ